VADLELKRDGGARLLEGVLVVAGRLNTPAETGREGRHDPSNYFQVRTYIVQLSISQSSLSTESHSARDAESSKRSGASQ